MIINKCVGAASAPKKPPFCGSGAWTLVFGLSASITTRVARQAQVCYFAPTMCKLRLRRAPFFAYRAASARVLYFLADLPGGKVVPPAGDQNPTQRPFFS